MRPGCWSRNLREYQRIGAILFTDRFICCIIVSVILGCFMDVYTCSDFFLYALFSHIAHERKTQTKRSPVNRYAHNYCLYLKLFMGMSNLKAESVVCSIFPVKWLMSSVDTGLIQEHRQRNRLSDICLWLWLNKAIRVCNPVTVLRVIKKENTISSIQTWDFAYSIEHFSYC